MRYRSTLFTLVLWFFVVAPVWSQQSTIQPIPTDVFPPTPNTASLGRFGNVPIGLSTGVPSISVPIYSYSGSNGLKLDVSISYHAGGIRVDEISSDVGIGWALNYGGEVSRTVRGLPDDIRDAGYFYLPSLREATYYINAYNAVYPPGGGLADPPTGAEDTVGAVYENRVDSQSDMFSYSLNGSSGKFVYSYGVDGEPWLIPHSKVKVERELDEFFGNYKTLKGFKLTDVDGLIYYYYEDENIYADLMGIFTPGGFSYSSSWRLTKIVDPFHRDSILFTYETAYIEYEYGLSETKFNYKTAPYQEDGGRATLQHNDYQANTKRIKTITLPDGTLVEFKYKSVERKDIKSPGALDQIIITNDSTSYGYKLWQSYRSGSSIVPYAPAPASVSETRRLYLDSIARFIGSNYEPAYKFTYQGSLPSRLSPNIDHWGYYSERASSSSSVSQYTFVNQYYDVHISGSDKTVDSLNVKSGILTKITYPTGGHTQFEYEANRAGDGKLVFRSQRTKTKSVSAVTPEPIVTIERDNFDSPISLDFSVTAWCLGVDEASCSFVMKLQSLDGTTTFAQQTFSYSERHEVKSSLLSNLPNGSYKLTGAYAPAGDDCFCDENYSARLLWKELYSDSSQLAGGVRVKRITDHDGMNSANDIVREYSYTKNDGTSSGIVALAPDFTYRYNEIVEHWNHMMINGNMISTLEQVDSMLYFARTSSLNFPLGYVSGSPVIYTRVKEQRIHGQENAGWLVATFNDFGNSIERVYPCPIGSYTQPAVSSCYPFPTPLYLDYEVGKPSLELYYDATGALVKKKQFTYQKIEDEREWKFTSFKIGLSKTVTKTAAGFEPTIRRYYVGITFYPSGGRMQLWKVRTVDYSGSDSLVVNQTNFYDNSYYTLKSTRTTDSKGQNSEVRFYYPNNYDPSADAAVYGLFQKNMLAVPMSSEEWVTIGGSNYLKGAGILKYQQLGAQIVPHKFIQFESSMPASEGTIGVFNPMTLNRAPNYLRDKITYDAFDGAGNLLQFSKDGDVSSILWGYQNRYPICRIFHAQTSEVAYTSFENDGNNSWTIGSSLRTASAHTGDQAFNLANGNIQKTGLTSQSYVVSFWSQSADVRVNGNPATPVGSSVAGWTYYEVRLTTTSVTISRNGTGDVFIDELRLCPERARLVTYTYKPGSGVTSITNENNQSEYYEYDAFNRLIYIRDHDGGIVKSVTYHYKK